MDGRSLYGHENNRVSSTPIPPSLRALLTSVLRHQEDERRTLVRSLHDTVSQDLAALAIALAMMEKESGLSAVGRESLGNCQELARRALAEIKRLSHALCPPLIHEVGLESALEWYSERLGERHGAKVTFKLGEDVGRLSREQEITLFRVVEDTLGSIVTAPGFGSAEISLGREGNLLVLEVVRREADAGSARWGELLPVILSERMQAAGGRATVSSVGSATTVRATLPLQD